MAFMPVAYSIQLKPVPLEQGDLFESSVDLLTLGDNQPKKVAKTELASNEAGQPSQNPPLKQSFSILQSFIPIPGRLASKF